MVYNPYKNLSCPKKVTRYLIQPNVLMKMPNFTILIMFISTFLFVCLFTYSLYNDMIFYRVAYAPAVDSVLTLYAIFLQKRPGETTLNTLHEFLPELIRAATICFYFVYKYSVQEPTLIYLTLLYPVCILYRLFNCTKYNKSKFFGVGPSLIVRS